MKDVIHVCSFNHKGGLEPGPNFEVLEDLENGITFDVNEASLIVCSGDLCLEISRINDLSIHFKYDGKELTEVLPKLSGHVSLDDGIPR